MLECGEKAAHIPRVRHIKRHVRIEYLGTCNDRFAHVDADAPAATSRAQQIVDEDGGRADVRAYLEGPFSGGKQVLDTLVSGGAIVVDQVGCKEVDAA